MTGELRVAEDKQTRHTSTHARRLADGETAGRRRDGCWRDGWQTANNGGSVDAGQVAAAQDELGKEFDHAVNVVEWQSVTLEGHAEVEPRLRGTPKWSRG